VSIAFLGALPVSAVNIGLQASIACLQAEITKLELDITGLTPAIAASIEVGLDFPPVALSYAAELAARLNLAEITAGLDPTTWVSGAIDGNVELALTLGLIDLKLQVVLAITAPLELGLAVPGISGWSYSGTAHGFGALLSTATASGFGNTPAPAQVRATIIATESPGTWLGFSQGFNTGSSADGLHYLGQLGAAEWSTGLGTIMLRLRALLLELEGMKASLEAQLQISLGLNLPNPQILLDVGLGLDLGVMLENMVNVRADITVAIGNIQLRIDALLDLIIALNAQLSGGGLACWTYEGPASLLGEELLGQIKMGVPGGNGPTAQISGLVLASTPANMNTFSNIFAA